MGAGHARRDCRHRDDRRVLRAADTEAQPETPPNPATLPTPRRRRVGPASAASLWRRPQHKAHPLDQPKSLLGRTLELSSSRASRCPHIRVSKQGAAVGSEPGAADDHDRVTAPGGHALRQGDLLCRSDPPPRAVFTRISGAPQVRPLEGRGARTGLRAHLVGASIARLGIGASRLVEVAAQATGLRRIGP